MRVFVIAPTDLTAEREALHRTVARLNERQRADSENADRMVVIEGLQGAPKPGSEPGDVLLGLAWLGFRSSGGTDKEETDAHADLVSAAQTWPRAEPPRILLYRCMRLPASLAEIDGLELDRVARFFGPDEGEESTGVLRREYLLDEGLQDLLERDLQPIAASRLAAMDAEKRPDRSSREISADGGLEQWLTEGEAHEVSFLSVQVVGEDEIRRRHSDAPEEVEELFERFRELVADTAASNGGQILTWSGTGGVIIFWRRRRRDHAVMTGLKVLHNLPIFNLDLEQNTLSEPIRARTAAHDALIVYRRPAQEIDSGDLRLVQRLQRENTSPGELTVSKRLLAKVDPRLRHRFHFKGQFEEASIYACRLPAADRPPQEGGFDEIAAQLDDQIGTASSLLEALASSPDATAIGSIAAAVDGAYGTLNQFSSRFSQLDTGWPAELLESLARTAAKLRQAEEGLWRKLRLRHAEHKATGGVGSQLETTVKAAARRRARAVIILEKLQERATALAHGDQRAPAAEATAADQLEQKIDALLRADELDRETVVTDLLLNYKQDLMAHLASLAAGGGHRPILDKLWEAADLVVLDDEIAFRGHQRASDRRASEAFAAEPLSDWRFDTLEALLGSTGPATDDMVATAFGGAGHTPTSQDLQMAWRCLVLAHEENAVRRLGAFKLSEQSVWQAASHPSIPLPGVLALAERVKQRGDEDTQRIFFDCTRSRVASAVETFQSPEELEALTALTRILLEFPSLVQSGYFERLDEIIRAFIERTREAQIQVEFFETLQATLERAKQEAEGKAPGKLPVGVKRLPLTVQRRLAGDPIYLLWFVTHPDPRIAGETLQNIGLNNVERVLRLREINGSVFHTLLRKPELFARSQPLFIALNHPKCEQNFASRHIAGMGRSIQGKRVLEQIARNPSANPAIRAMAKRAMGTRR